MRIGIDRERFPTLAAEIEKGTVWIEDGEYVSIDLDEGDEVSVGTVGFEDQCERFLAATLGA